MATFIRIVLCTLIAGMSFPIAPSFSKTASCRPLLRTLSGLPWTNPLYQALMAHDLQAVTENMEHMPLSLCDQYWFYCNAKRPEIKEYILESLRNFWREQIYVRPKWAIEGLAFSFAQLCAPWSWCNGTIEDDFMVMLTDLKEEIGRQFSAIRHLRPIIALMPCLHQPIELKVLIAKILAANMLQRGISINGYLDELPADLKELIMAELPPRQEECSPTIPLELTPPDGDGTDSQ